MAFSPAEKPKSALGYHRLLSPTAAVKVSPLCLGGMSLGEAWGQMMGSVDKKASFELLDYFYSQGGNFIDTANNYQNEESEIFIGEWMKERGNRDEIVLATKYTTGYRSYEGTKFIQSNFGGNNAKSLKLSIEASLKKLQTSYIDLLWLHWWDYSTSVPEVMHALHNAVVQGKVLYLGVSDTPAWIVSKANEYARAHNLTPFVTYQGKWSAATRDFERDIIPMAKMEGMGLNPWGSLGGGNFKTKAQREKNDGRKMYPANEKEIKLTEVLEKIADRKKTALTSVALAYVMHKTPHVAPIVGGRTIEHLKGNIEALNLELSREDMDEIEDAVPFDLGFPHNFAARGKPKDISGSVTGQDVWLTNMFGNFDYVEPLRAIPLGKHKDEEK